MCAYRQCPDSTDSRIVPSTSRFRGAFGLLYCSGHSSTHLSNGPLDKEWHLPQAAYRRSRHPLHLDFPRESIHAPVCFRRLDTRRSRLTHRVNINQTLLVIHLEQYYRLCSSRQAANCRF